jgi:cytosine/adenosine deaminase-related metal-dependent hydrolase
MSEALDLVLRNGYVRRRETSVDIAIQDGTIVEVTDTVDRSGQVEIDAGGDLLAPGFVDAHKHIDRALSASGERMPLANSEPNDSPEYIGELFDRYYEETPRTELKARVVRDIEMAVESGTTHIRSHIAVDHSIGAELVEVVLEAYGETSDIVDLELVPYATRGLAESEPAVRETIEMCRDRIGPENVLLGGSIGLVGGQAVRSIDGTVRRWFELASDLDVDLDVHVTARGAAGYYALMRLAENARQFGYQERVTVVHAWALAHLPDWWLTPLLDTLADVGIDIVTCYNSIRESMPVDEIVERGVTLAHGTDNDQDFVYANGNADPLEAAMVMSYTLVGDWHFNGRYRWSETNPALGLFWEMLTSRAAAVAGVDNEYGIVTGTPADLVVLDEPSPEWAIIRQANRRAVIKDGTVVARDGEITVS